MQHFLLVGELETFADGDEDVDRMVSRQVSALGEQVLKALALGAPRRRYKRRPGW